jgi:hypothetical protein
VATVAVYRARAAITPLRPWAFVAVTPPPGRGENGLGTRNGYQIRVLIWDNFLDTDTGIFIFGTDTNNTRIVQLQIWVGFGASTTR